MCDAVALVVSEETGIVSAAIGGVLTRNLNQASLYKLITETHEETDEDAPLFTRLLRRRSEKKAGGKDNHAEEANDSEDC